MAAGSIVIDLLLKTGAFETDTKRAEKALAQFKKQAADVGRVVGAAFAVATTAAAAMVRASINAADEMAKAAQKAGVTVESLSSLAYAADLAGVNNEALTASMVKLSKNMSDANQGIGESIKAFDALGVSVKNSDGSLKTTDQMLTELAGKFATFKDGTEKTALAVALFGRSGAELIPFLNQGAEGIAELQAEADRLGITLSTDAAQAAEQFNDNLTRISSVSKGLFNRITAELLPSLVNLTEQLFNGASGSQALDKAARIAASGIKVLISSGLIIGGVLKTIGEYFGGLAATMVALFTGRFKDAFELAKDTVFDFGGNVKATVDSVSAVWNDSANKIASKAPDTGEKLAAPAIQMASKVKQAAKTVKEEVSKVYDAIEKQIASIARSIAVFGKSESEIALFDLAAGGATQEQLERARQMLAIQEEMRKNAEAQSAYQSKLESLITDTDIENTRKLYENMDVLNRAFFDGEIGVEQYEQAIKNLTGSVVETTKEMDEFSKNAVKSIQQSFADFLFDPFQSGLDGMLKGFGEMLKRMIAEAVAADIARRLFGDKAEGGSGGGLLGGALDFFSGLFSFAGGGYTGSGARSGGVDGMGGFPAILHPQESVIDHSRGQKVGGGGNTIIVNVNGSNNAPDVRRAAAQGAREGLGMLNAAQRYA